MEYPEEREPAEEMSISADESAPSYERRYPNRDRKPPQYLTDYMGWDGMGPQVTTVTPNKLNTSFREGVMLETRLYIEPSA